MSAMSSKGQQYLNLINEITRSSVWHEAMETITKNPSKTKKLIIDHGHLHAEGVVAQALKFLDELEEYPFRDFVYPERIEPTGRDQYLVTIAALLHDIGLSKSEMNHAFSSAEMAKELFLDKSDLAKEDKDIIIDAIERHSDGFHLIEDFNYIKTRARGLGRTAYLETDLVVPVALYLADKLDVHKGRLAHEGNPECTDPKFDSLVEAFSKINKVEFRLVAHNRRRQKGGGSLPVDTAELHYYVDEGFDVNALSLWPKCIAVPRKVAKDFLGLKKFKFFVNNDMVKLDQIIRDLKHFH